MPPNNLPNWMIKLTFISLLFLMIVSTCAGIAFAERSGFYGYARVFGLVLGYGIALLSNTAGVFLFFMIDKLELRGGR